MPTAKNAALHVEQGATLTDFAAMTDSGDHKIFNNGADLWSGKAGQEPVVRPNGVVTGRNLVSPAVSGDDDKVDVAAFSAYSQGVLRTVAAAADVALTRAVATDTHCINSITMTSAGAVAVVVGTDGTAFSEVRGAAGGPPLIPVDSVELAQVRMASNVAAPVAAGEIYQTIGQHCERYDYPTWSVNNIGEGIAADVAARANAFVEFAAALPAIHTGAVARKVYMKFYEPVLAEVARVSDFVPPETSYSVSSKQFYKGSVASTSESIGQGSFTVLLGDGVGDSLVQDKGEVLTFKYFPDENRAPFIVCQGTLGIARQFPATDQIAAACTISAEKPAAEFNG